MYVNKYVLGFKTHRVYRIKQKLLLCLFGLVIVPFSVINKFQALYKYYIVFVLFCLKIIITIVIGMFLFSFLKKSTHRRM